MPQFVSPVTLPGDPTENSHAATKSYVDSKTQGTSSPVALADTETIATDASLGSTFRVTLGGNRTLGNPTGMTDGQKVIWEISQDVIGGRALTLGPAFVLGTDLATVTLSTAANTTDYLGAVYHAPSGSWRVVALMRGLPAVPPGWVQSASGQSGAGSTSLSLVLPSAPRAGNLLVFAMAGDKNTGGLTLPGFQEAVPTLLGASVSLYYYWKTSDGTETSITPSWPTASPEGNMAWCAEYQDAKLPGAPWSVIGAGSTPSDGADVTSWPTGGTGPLPSAGLGVAVAAVESNSSVTTVNPWGNGYDEFYSSTAGGLRAAVFVADKVEDASRTPGQILNIGSGSGQNHFSVQVAPNGAAEIATHTQAQIAAGYDEHPYFTATPDHTAVQFWARMDGPTTSGTTQARSELREQDLAGANMGFDANTGEHWMRGRTRITHLPPNKPEAVIAQLHNGDSDRIAIRTQLISSQIKLLCRINGSSTGLVRFEENYVVGTEFEWMIKVVNGAISVYYNDMVTPLITAAAGTLAPTAGITSWYFKSGCYNQSNETTDDPFEWCSAELRSLQHWHTGWPALTSGVNSRFNFAGIADQTSAAIAVFSKGEPGASASDNGLLPFLG